MKNIDNLLEREKLTKIIANLDRREYLAIIGPRQAGKTTLLEVIQEFLVKKKEVLTSQVKLVTFQDPTLLASFEQNPVAFVKAQVADDQQRFYLLIDEFQYAHQAGPSLKLVYDTIKNLKIIITGSSSLELRQIASSMVGRIFTYELRQLEYLEMLALAPTALKKTYQQLQTLLDDLISEKKDLALPELTPQIRAQGLMEVESFAKFGSYPAVFLTKDSLQKEEVLLNIYNTYVEKDLVRLLQLGSFDNFLKLIKYLALTIGQLFNASHMQRELGLSYREVATLIPALEQTYLIKLVKPYYTNKINQIRKSPLVYFYDTGLRNWAVRNFNTLDTRQDLGHLIENVVLKRLLKLVEEQRELTEIKFWRTNAGSEVDFVIEKLGENPYPLPIEVKYRKFTRPKLTRAYHSFLNQYQPKVGIVVTRDFLALETFGQTRVLFVPLYLW